MNLKKLHFDHHHITGLCVMLIILGAVAYMYFLSLSVVHVVMRKEVNQNINQLRSEIAYLESAYIEAHHVISSRVATTEGFNEIKEKVFINTAEQNLVLRTSGE
jgi:hypothetical protein